MSIISKAAALAAGLLIRDEVAERANTALRVGQAIADIACSASFMGIDVTALGAVGNGVSDDTAVINAAITTVSTLGGGQLSFPRGTYMVSGVTLKSGVELVMEQGAKLKLLSNSNEHVVTIANGATRIAIRGGEIDGNKANNTGGHGISSSSLSTISDLRIIDCYIHDCAVDGVRPGGTTNGFLARGNILENNGTYAGGGAGLSAENVNHFTFAGNIARGNFSHGVGVNGVATYGSIVGNECNDNGQANPVGPTADGITGYNAGNLYVTISGNTCSGGNDNGIHWGGKHFTITGNTCKGMLRSGIVAISGFGGGAAVENVTISGNTILGAGDNGIRIELATNFAISGNTIADCGAHGITIDSGGANNTQGSVTGNVCADNAASGIRVNLADNIDFAANTLRNNGSFGYGLSGCSDCSIVGGTVSGSGSDGILLNNTSRVQVTGVHVRGNRYCVEEAGSADYNTFSGGDFRNNTDDKLYLIGANTQWRGSPNSDVTSVASAAALPVPIGADMFDVSGTTTVTSLTGQNWRGRTITLRFLGVLTFTDGGNLKLAGNFVTTADDTITLRGDSTNWYEMSRSVN